MRVLPFALLYYIPRFKGSVGSRSVDAPSARRAQGVNGFGCWGVRLGIRSRAVDGIGKDLSREGTYTRQEVEV